MYNSRWNKGSTWTNKHGTVYVDVYRCDWRVWDRDKKIEIPCLKQSSLEIDGQMLIEFSSTGFEEDAQLYGPPEDCHPADGSDERTLVRVSIETIYETIRLTTEQENAIFDMYCTEVYEADLDCD